MISPVGKSAYLITICDGMGGAAAGDVASRTAISCFNSFVSANYTPDGDMNELLLDAVLSANTLVFETAAQNENYEGMGTTLVSALITPEKTYVVNVGDSRLYQLNNNFLYQITRDHSFVRMLVDRGEISLAEAEVHPARHWLTKSLGIEKEVKPDFYEITLAEGDILMLCTDGLYGEQKNEEMLSMIDGTDYTTLEKSAADLIDSANRHGGLDNATIILAKY